MTGEEKGCGCGCGGSCGKGGALLVGALLLMFILWGRRELV